MIKQIITFILLLSSFNIGLYAQKKDIAQAKTLLKSGKDLEKAESLMRKVLADTTKKYDEKHWSILFDIIKKQYDNINERIYLKQRYDTIAVFNNISKLFIVADTIASLNLGKQTGRSKSKQEKKYAEILDTYRPNLYSGGLYFINKKNYNQAYKLLEIYINCANIEMFKDYQYHQNDTLIYYASYWCVYCGYKINNPEMALKYSKLAANAKLYNASFLQYLADIYRIEKDTNLYLSILQEGFSKFPTVPFFYTRIIEHYSDINKWESVLAFSKEALINSKNNRWLQIAQSTALLNLEKYSECILLCDSLIQQVDTIPAFYLNAGLAYFNQGIQLDKHKQKNNKLILQLYSKAKPYIEKYRKLEPSMFDKWGLPLYTIYLNLNQGKEFDEIDKLMKGKK